MASAARTPATPTGRHPSNPPQRTAPRPPTVTPAPTSPPTSACEDDDGNPHHHVARFHVTAARSDGEQDPQRVGRPDTDEATDRVGNRSTSQDRPQDREDRRQGHRSARSHRPRGHRRRYRVRRVMESVGHVECDGEHDDDDKCDHAATAHSGQCPSLRARVGTSWRGRTMVACGVGLGPSMASGTVGSDGRFRGVTVLARVSSCLMRSCRGGSPASAPNHPRR